MNGPTGQNRAEAARATVEPLLTVEDLERLLRVHRRTIARMCKRGELSPPIKIGGGNRWKIEDVEQMLRRGGATTE